MRRSNPVREPSPRIDVLVSAVGSWATVRVQQPFKALQQLGWDVLVHEKPRDLNATVRANALVIWQRPLPSSWEHWLEMLQLIRRKGSILVVEWDDHPNLFPREIQQQLEACRHAHLRIAHALHCSCPALARVLQRFHPHTLVVENGVAPIPPLNLNKHREADPLRVFLGNLNREEEHRRLVPSLRRWLSQDSQVQLLCAGPTGITGLLPQERVERHPLLNYVNYRKLLASCQLALLPLEQGEPQACKTPIKWLEAAAESTVVIAGPELYGPWLANNRYGLWTHSIEAMVPLASQANAESRQALAQQAHEQVQRHSLQQQLVWRQELYRHLWRMAPQLDRQLLQRCPDLNA